MKFTLLKTNVLLINKYKLIVLFLTTKRKLYNEKNCFLFSFMPRLTIMYFN